MKKLLSCFLLSAIAAFAMGDGGFELTNPGDLPLWSGAFWTRASQQGGTMQVIEDARQAHGGAKFLRVENDDKRNIYTLAHPQIKPIEGMYFRISIWARGTGLASLSLTPYTKENKCCPWTAQQQTNPTKMTGEWQKLEMDYIPQEGEAYYHVETSVKEGTVDYDDCKLEIRPLSEKPQQPKTAVKPAALAQPKAAAQEKPNSEHYITSDFEKWENGMPLGWTTDYQGSTVRRSLHSAAEAMNFGESGMYLDGKVYMAQPMQNLREPRGRLMRISFYAKGENGHVTAYLRQGRNGFVDYMTEVLESDTTSEWKKYSTQMTLPPNAAIDNCAVQFDANGVVIDKLEFMAAKGGDGKQILTIPVANPITIDGVRSPGEWDVACGASDGFQHSSTSTQKVKPCTPALSQQSAYRFTSDGTYLYFLFETPNASNLKRDFKGKDAAVYYDDSFEIHVNPEYGNVSPKYSYQFIFNANDAIFDQRRIKGSEAAECIKWNSGTVQVKSGFGNNVWTLEGRVSLAELGLSLDQEFGLIVAVSRTSPLEEGTLGGSEFLVLNDRMTRATVSTTRPGLRWTKNGDWGTMAIDLANGKNAPAGDFRVEYVLDSENCSVTKQETVHLASGGTSSAFFYVPEGAGQFGTMVLTMKDKADATIYRYTMDFSKESPRPTTRQKPLEFHILPEQGKFAVNLFTKQADFSDLASVEINGLPQGKVTLKKSDLQKFNEILVYKAPIKLVDKAKLRFNVLVLNSKGEIIASTIKEFTVDDSLMPQDSSDNYQAVLAPYAPIKLDGRTASLHIQKYTFGDNGLPSKMNANGANNIYAPVHLVAEMADGREIVGKGKDFKVTGLSDIKMQFQAVNDFGSFTVSLKGTLEYDGAIAYQATINSTKPVSVKRLSLEMPFERLDFFHAFMDSQLRLWMCRQPEDGEYRHPSVETWTPDTIPVFNNYRRFCIYFFPKGDGLLFSSKNIVDGVILDGFMPFLTFGNYKCGMEFFADTDRGWVHTKGSTINEILRQGGKELVRVNFIASPYTINGSRSFEFGIMGTPGRHKTNGGKFKNYYINGYSHTGFTDQTLAGLRVKDWKLFAEQYSRWKAHTPIYLCCKGFYPQLDKVAQYLDSEWRTYPNYNFKDNITCMPSHQFGLDARAYISPAGCYTPGRVNFYSNRFRELITKLPDMQGIYWDENWMKPCNSPNHADCGYLLDDGRVQGRAWWWQIREVDRRLRQIFVENGRPNPNLAMFTGEGIIPHAFSFGTSNCFCEHFTYDMDFIDYWTPHFMEIAAAGAWGFDVGFFGMFRDPKYLTRLDMNRAVLAIVKLYQAAFDPSNFNFQLARKFENIEKNFGLEDSSTQFLGYFMDENKAVVSNLPATAKATLWIHQGKDALVYLTNLDTKTASLSPKFDLSQYGIAEYTVIDAETKQQISLDNISIPKHDFKVLILTRK